MKRMNLGCADVQPDGWDNVDANPYWRPAIVWDPSQSPTGRRVHMTGLAGVLHDQFVPEGYDLIVVNHVLQHVHWNHQHAFLANCHAALRPGGVLRVICPDPVAAFHAYVAGDADWFPVSGEAGCVDLSTLDAKLCAYLTQCSANLTIHTPPLLIQLLLGARFRGARVVGFGESMLADDYEPCALDSRRAESFIVEGRA